MCVSSLGLRRRGFNLIEAAIVLGVIGLVIGGIWVAAAAINDRLLVRNMMMLITSAVEVTRSHYQTLGADSDISPLMASHDLPPGFKKTPDFALLHHSGTMIYNGRQSASFMFNPSSYSATGRYLYGEIHFNVINGIAAPYNSSNFRPYTSLCVEISKWLMQADMGPSPDDGGHQSIGWANQFVVYNWNVDDPPMSVQDIISYCNSSSSLFFYWSKL